jgi:SAM-dependent methyltransferase
MSTIPAAAKAGFSDASSYDKFRPSYPPSAVSGLLKNLGLEGQKGARIVDLGAGTGKFTELLSQRPEGFEIIPVEPHEGMRTELEKKQLKGVKIAEGISMDMPFDDSSADAVIVAQVMLEASTCLGRKELTRLIGIPLVRPIPHGHSGLTKDVKVRQRAIVERNPSSYSTRRESWFNMECGRLCVVNSIHPLSGSKKLSVEDNQPKSWTTKSSYEEKMKSIMWSFVDSHNRFRHERWRDVFEHQGLLDPLFSLPLGEESTEWTVWLSKEAVWDRFSTLSQIAVLEGQEKDVRDRPSFDTTGSSYSSRKLKRRSSMLLIMKRLARTNMAILVYMELHLQRGRPECNLTWDSTASFVRLSLNITWMSPARH